MSSEARHCTLRQFAAPIAMLCLLALRVAAGAEDPAALEKQARSLEEAHNYAAAEKAYRALLAARTRQHGRLHAATADAANAAARMCFQQANYAEAAKLYRETLAIRQKVLGPDAHDTAWSRHCLAWVVYSMGNAAEARRMYARCLPALEKALGREHPTVADCLVNSAAVAKALGERAEAARRLQRALGIYEQKLGKDHPNLAVCLYNLGVLRGEQGRLSEAVALLKRGLDLRQKHHGPQDPAIAHLLNAIAVLHGKQGLYAEAEAEYQQSARIYEKVFGEGHPLGAAPVGNLGELYVKQGRLADARLCLHKSLGMLEKRHGPRSPSLLTTLTNLAVLEAVEKQFPKAQGFLDRAIAIGEAAFGPDHPGILSPLRNRAVLAVDMGRPEEAWAYAVRARRALRRARRSGAATALGRAALVQALSPRASLPGIALMLGKQTDVLALVEEEQALALRDLLAQAQVQASVGLPPAEREALDAALAELNRCSAAVANARRAGRPLRSLADNLERAERAYDTLQARLNSQYERFAAQGRRSLTSADIQRIPALDGHTAAIGWVTFDERTWAYIVRKNGVTWIDQSQTMTPGEANRLVGEVLDSRRKWPQDTPPAEPLLALYRARLEPALPRLQGVRHLILIAQGWPAILPAGMLLVKPPPKDKADLAKWPWLSNAFAVSTVPSLTALEALSRKKRGGAGHARSLFAIGDPPFSSRQLAQMRAAPAAPPDTPQTDGLLALLRASAAEPGAAPPRLPGTRREIQLLADLFGARAITLLLGPAATERALVQTSRRGDLKPYRYIHFATHGLAHAERPELSALLLSLAEPDDHYDGVLHMREIFHLELNADLVVLSACQTGLGKQFAHEGMVGLATSFFVAGARSLVVTLWNVPDASTALLMRRFYTSLRAGTPKAEALREAKAWLRGLTRAEIAALGREGPLLADLTRGLGKPVAEPKGHLTGDRPFAHPYYWAGFVLTGDPR